MPGGNTGAPGPYAPWTGSAGQSRPGQASAIPPSGSGYAFGPGGAGWNAPGWQRPQSPFASAPRPDFSARLAARVPRGQTGRLVTVGIASALVGALLGGGIVAVTAMAWDRADARASWDVGGDRQRFFPRGYDQGVPQSQSNPLPPWCRSTEAGVRCQAPG
ncbi:hypothetical protein [Microbispora sp. H11081]|uniref:hypothetical protein n=1 Tax=Microbispora sp. H11081 TaxID=2729107 RepID=UPI001B8C5C38|nr:hypothetical protein [Microbispora sp. H11081]